MTLQEDTGLFCGRWIVHFERREAVQLRWVYGGGAGELHAIINSRNPQNVVRNVDRRTGERIIHFPRRIQRRHDAVARQLTAAVKLIKENQIAFLRVSLSRLEGAKNISREPYRLSLT